MNTFFNSLAVFAVGALMAAAHTAHAQAAIDTDGDGIPDAAEAATSALGSFGFTTNPNRRDNNIFGPTTVVGNRYPDRVLFTRQQFRDLGAVEVDTATNDAWSFTLATSTAMTNSSQRGAKVGFIMDCITARWESYLLDYQRPTSLTPVAQRGFAQNYCATVYEQNVMQVLGLYRGVLGRAAEKGGADFWIDQISRNLQTTESLASAFANAPELIAGGVVTDEDFINRLYQVLLGRQADAPGLAYWTQQVATQGRGKMVLAFTQSLEFARLTLFDLTMDAIRLRMLATDSTAPGMPAAPALVSGSAVSMSKEQVTQNLQAITQYVERVYSSTVYKDRFIDTPLALTVSPAGQSQQGSVVAVQVLVPKGAQNPKLSYRSRDATGSAVGPTTEVALTEAAASIPNRRAFIGTLPTAMPVGDYVFAAQSGDTATTATVNHSVVTARPEVAWAGLLTQLTILAEDGTQESLETLKPLMTERAFEKYGPMLFAIKDQIPSMLARMVRVDRQRSPVRRNVRVNLFFNKRTPANGFTLHFITFFRQGNNGWLIGSL
jgi:hypothetical protein